MEKPQPQLRFPEFKGDWELATFNNFFKIGSSKRVLQEQWQTKGVPFYRTRELVKLALKEEIKNDIYINEDLYNDLKNTYGVPQIGDILVSGVGTLGISFIIENLNPFYFKDGNVIWFKKIKNINSKYFNYVFQNDFVQNQILDNASITTVGTFTIDNANKTKFYYTKTIEEQTKIANFLSSVDEKLNLLKDKKLLLEDYKKGMMQKIFNQEIRFKADNGNDFADWEENNIGNILTIGSGRDYKHLNFGSVPVFGTGGLMTYVDSCLHKGETVCIGRKGTIDKPMFHNGDIWTVDTLFYTHSFINSIPKFVYYVFQSINWKKHNEGSGVPSLSKSTIEQILINVPSTLEQIKIANFLSSIDDKIELVSNQIKDTQEYKIGLLQQMFV